MLQAINDRIKGWLGIAIVILIGLPFALWGIQSYLDDTGPQYAAKVNSMEISAQELDRAVSRQRQELMRQNNGKLTVDEKVLRERTLNQLINQCLLEDFTYQNNYRISDLVLSQRIKQLFTVDGVFDRQRFETIVASNGMSIPMYEQALRNELRLQQMQSAITGTAFVTDEESRRLAALNDQTRDVSVVTFNIEHFSTASKPTAEEIKAYYQENIKRFMVPEKVKIDYVEISSDSLADSIDIDEAQIKKMYDDYVNSVKGREERKARHILLKTSDDKAAAKEKIESLKQQLEQGADFAELAKKYSQDSGSAAQGGELGWVAMGEMVKPFEQVLFGMEKGGVSDVVETQFGYHLIQLEDVRSEPVAPLGVKRYEFEDELKADTVASMFYDLTERLASIAYENPDNLDVIIDDMGLAIKTSDYFTRYKGEGVAANDKVREVAFSPLVLEEGSNSDVVEISPIKVVVLRLNEHVAATPMPLEEVSSRIENILKAQGGHKQTMAAALEAKARIEGGEPVADVVASLESAGVTLDVIKSLSRSDNSKVPDSSILQAAFNLQPSADGKPAVKEIDLMTGDVALVILDKINIPGEVSDERLQVVKSQLLNEKAIHEFSSTMLFIKDNADIDRNKRVLDQ